MAETNQTSTQIQREAPFMEDTEGDFWMLYMGELKFIKKVILYQKEQK